MKKKSIAKRLEISGVVQGVGFRPFLYGLAHTHCIRGEVSNTADGVLTTVEGGAGDVDRFIRDITEKQPPLARVDRIVQANVPLAGFSEYRIIRSSGADGRRTLISPDVSVCGDCLAEMRDPGDRRFGYPFINCTNCGPRFTIIRDIPYDRPKTSMQKFEMCPDCRSEYEDPLDRRFHAQPNACPVCGPHVFLTDSSGIRKDLDPGHALDAAGEYLKQGHILAVKGLGGFHLAADASNDDAVRELRKRKQRPHKPFALMARSASVLFDHVRVSARERELLASFHRPIVLLEKKDVRSDAGLSPALAPFNTCLGIMLPYTPLHYLLLEKGPDILVMTSGNRSGEPLSVDNHDALDAFSHIADYFLLHNRDIYFRADDSIARIQAGKQRFIRRSRGYAPLPVPLAAPLPGILGCGAGLKNTVCLVRDDQAFLSQHIGDLENQKSDEFFRQTVDHYQKILDIRPGIIAHDLHPGYLSTVFAEKMGKTQPSVRLVPVQHHHAHAVSCMAEHGLDGRVVAITLDGTGLGTDGRIWGGEILTCTHGTFTRHAHLTYIHMPGGDAAVLEPWRMAASVLYAALGDGFADLDISYIRETDRDKLGFICRMMDRDINSPLTSSCGRLFDAVSSLLCIRHAISHESQAAMELEAVAAEIDDGDEPPPYTCEPDSREPGLIDSRPWIREIVADIQAGVSPAVISYRFHRTLVAAFARAAEMAAREAGIHRVVLSGGVFNNHLILTGMIRALENLGLTVFSHTRVPTGDGGIALGQVVAAAAVNQSKGKKT